MFNKSIIFVLLSIVAFTSASSQENWLVPDDKQSKLSPFEFTDSTINLGKEYYYSLDKGNCVSCHGNPGKNNWQKLVPSPNDLAGDKIQNNSDGELYHKISQGRGLMPSFKDILKPDELWNLISYLRSYNNLYAQEIAKQIQRTGYNGSVSIVLSLLGDKKIQTQIIGEKEGVKELLSDVEIKLAASRWFGTLPIEETKLTNSEGIVTFTIPSDIPGDSLGFINFIAQVTNKELYGDVRQEASFSVGKATNQPSLVARRAMWNKVKMAPLWIMVTYSGGVAMAWGIIFYILLQVRRIFRIGLNEESLKK